jgi:hypothetical protein
VQQHGAEVGLELPDAPAQRRLADVQPRGGPAEVPFLGDRHEVAQAAQVHQAATIPARYGRYRNGLGHRRRYPVDWRA